ncbi:MAG: RIP metalloprotease RseP, partial [Pseudobdellovibrionaceae bacterium]|nr:RIP metalloprotease RseP [Pseudobdellovibrionaceae bacterium]
MDSLLNYFEMGLSSIIPFIILLGVLIFVHELGHFLVARWCGVKVEVFSLGFGKKIFKKKWGDTEYAISLIPLGGYVKMFGDEVGKEVPASERKVSFLHKPVGQRIAIVLAGPIMNLLFAGVVFFFLAWSGEVRRGAELGDIESQSYAYEVGFRSGDLIVTVDDQQVRSWDEVQEVLTHKV